MRFGHDEAIWRDFPQLAAGVIVVEGVAADLDVTEQAQPFWERADARRGVPEADLPPIQAWRRAYAQMGLKPTQYRCASEALLRRHRKDGALPPIHPLVDLCNVVSLASAIPIAVFDLDRIDGALDVRYAHGTETYLAFSGETEQPAPGEVIFADAAARAHARRWTNRQSAASAISAGTARALIVAEALHEGAGSDIDGLLDDLERVLAATSASLTLRVRLCEKTPVACAP